MSPRQLPRGQPHVCPLLLAVCTRSSVRFYVPLESSQQDSTEDCRHHRECHTSACRSCLCPSRAPSSCQQSERGARCTPRVTGPGSAACRFHTRVQLLCGLSFLSLGEMPQVTVGVAGARWALQAMTAVCGLSTCHTLFTCQLSAPSVLGTASHCPSPPSFRSATFGPPAPHPPCPVALPTQ